MAGRTEPVRASAPEAVDYLDMISFGQEEQSGSLFSNQAGGDILHGTTDFVQVHFRIGLEAHHQDGLGI